MSFIKNYDEPTGIDSPERVALPIAWRVETVRTLRNDRRVFQARLRDDDNRIVCFGFGKNPNAGFLRLSTHAQGTYFPVGSRQDSFRHPDRLPVIEPKDLPLALLALERFKEKK